MCGVTLRPISARRTRRLMRVHIVEAAKGGRDG
jgi:hypothetical protein